MGDSTLSQSQAFAAALQRAKQIAAKIQPSGGGGGGGSQIGQKRPYDDENGPDAKKFSSPGNGNNGGNMSNAVAQAAAVAARLAATGGSVVEEEIRFPEKISGMMLGRGSNDTLSHIEIESGAKIQISKDANRCCVLRGSRESVTKAREMIQQLSSQNGGGMVEILVTISMPPPGPSGFPPYQEIMVPGPKVGLVIGKGGETIKMLQEKTGAKMVIIQDGPNQEVVEKPLRISGDNNKIEHAKTLVFELIRDKETNAVAINTNPLADTAEVFVPKIAVGVVIGKGGDMIKKIQGETGCKLQFIQGKNDEPGDRRCIINGNREQVESGKRMIEGLIESVLRSNEKNGRYNNNGNQQALADQSNYGYGYGVNHTQPAGREEVTFSVPASKCGIVIGRGGETIKLINQQSGAHCEMDRTANNPPTEKLFKAKGTSEQIEHARQLISEKINMDIVIASRKTINGGGGGSGGGGNSGGGYDNSNYQQQWGNTGGYGQQSWEQPQAQPAGANGAQTSGGQDYSQQWIEYYKSMGMTREAEAIEMQMKQKQQQEQASQNNGQPQDYSAQWAEYYRSIGKTAEAEAIEKQITTNKSNPSQNSSQGSQQSQQPPSQQPSTNSAGYPPNMAAQYAQYSQYYAAAAGQGQGFPGPGGYPGGYGMYQQGQGGGQQGGGNNGQQHKKQDKK